MISSMGIRRCLGCMKEIAADTVRCPHCGFSKEDLLPLNVLPLKTVLHSRYIVGKPLKVDGEGITYIAYDGKDAKAVVIREYMPGELAERNFDSIDVKPGCEAKFKALKSDFTELYSVLYQLQELESIQKVTELFEENGTAYAVCEHIEGITLNQFILQNAGELDWEETGEMFRSLLEALSVVHKRGIVHRGISPETIMVTPARRLKLTGFSICSARTANSEITGECYDGYAAPEQYANALPHGEWTDVYGICAVLYKVLTGTMPPAANLRTLNDNLIEVSQMNDTVPVKISHTLLQGMAPDHTRRCPSIVHLMDALYSAEKTDPNILMSFSAEAKEAGLEHTVAFRAGETVLPKQEPPKGKKKLPLWAWLLIVCVPVIIGATILLYGLMIGFGDSRQKHHNTSETSSQLTESVEESSAEESEESSQVEQHVVDDFVGKMYDDVISTAAYTTVYHFAKPVYEYNENYKVGEIFAQSIKAESLVDEGTEITLSVSMGPRYIALPATASYTAREYAQMLVNDYNISAKVADTKEYSDTILPGYITRVEPGTDELYDVDSGVTVVVYESMGQDPMKEVSEEMGSTDAD